MNRKSVFRFSIPMVRFASLAFLLLFLFPSFNNLFILIQFESNQDYISRELCEKKNIPDNHCRGNCFLKKQLEKETKKEKQVPIHQFKEGFKNKFLIADGIIFLYPSDLSERIFFMHEPRHAAGFRRGIFHPPCLA